MKASTFEKTGSTAPEQLSGDALIQNQIKSSRLSYKQGKILFHGAVREYIVDLNCIFLPPTSARQVSLTFAAEIIHIQTAVALADYTIQNSRDGKPDGRSIVKRVTFLRNVLDWLSVRGVYSLSAATRPQINDLIKELALIGWAGALQLETRWHKALDEMEEHIPDEAFHFERDSGNHNARIGAIKLLFWNQVIGLGGKFPVPKSVIVRIETMMASRGFSNKWKFRKNREFSQLTSGALSTQFCWFNDLNSLPSNLDGLRFHPIDNPFQLAKSLTNNRGSRTSNLGVAQAISLLTTSIKWIYEYGPLANKIIGDARADFAVQPRRKRKVWLESNNDVKLLSFKIGRKITHWAENQSTVPVNESYTMDKVVASLQGACAIIIAALNARRAREICDAYYGLRIGDLEEPEKGTLIRKATFYIEKTYRDRHTFYVNKLTTDAIKCLEDLKSASHPLKHCAPKKGDSLFDIGRMTVNGPNREVHFFFGLDNKRTRSLSTFLKFFTEIDADACETTPHMFRRFFSILFLYRYDNAELRALSQHLRHREISGTRCYVTDPDNRELADGITTKYGENSPQRIRAEKLSQSLNLEGADLSDVMTEVGKERLASVISHILCDGRTGGGFSRVVRKYYRIMLSNVEFSDEPISTQIDSLRDKLDERGFHPFPFLHGDCYAGIHQSKAQAKCRTEGEINHVRASPELCRKCMFHYNSEEHMSGLRDELQALDDDRSDFMLPPLEQHKANIDYDNLQKVIWLNEQVIQKNYDTLNNIDS